MKTKDKLLEKYYKGETSLEEERLLRESVFLEQIPSAEKDAFSWYRLEGMVPDSLDTILLEGIKRTENKSHIRRLLIARITGIAASVILIISLYIGIRAERSRRIESDFFVMEQALYQVSESLQTQEEEEMLVLWVDEDVEIIIK